MDGNQDIAGTFTGFLVSLAEIGVQKFEISIERDFVELRVVRAGREASVMIGRVNLMYATADIASIELGELLSGVL